MRIFVSSVVVGYEEYRNVARETIEAAGHTPVLVEAQPVTGLPPQEECLLEIQRSDAVAFLLGGRYGTPQASGKSPVHEEWKHALDLGKTILVFREQVSEVDSKQQVLLKEVEPWETGKRWGTFANPAELAIKIVAALKHLEDSTEQAKRLPPACLDLIKQLRVRSASRANRLVELLTDSMSRRAGVLERLVQEPLDWLADAEEEAWEAISHFLGAFGLPGDDLALQRAIDAGSPRSGLHLIHLAISAAEDGNGTEVERLLQQVPADHPLLDVARKRIEENPSAAIEALMQGHLHESDDPDIALFGVVTLVWAYWEENRAELAVEVLRKANQRFPNRAMLLYHQANMTLGVVDQVGLDSSDSRDLLREAAELMLCSRDCFRQWDGPSHRSVAMAMQARLFLDEPKRAADLAVLPPEGEAIESEAADLAVQGKLAHAYMMLGRYVNISSLQIDGIDPSEAAFIRAMRAHALGDPAALPQMRLALSEATDESAKKRALLGLAQCGEVDEAAMVDSTEAERPLYRGVAALSQENYQAAISFLSPHRFATPRHAEFLARAQHLSGASSEAIRTLERAVEHFGTESLLEWIVELHILQEQLDEAESVAKDALSRNPSAAVRYRLRRWLMNIASKREDMQSLETYALSMVQEYPQDEEAHWQVVHALHRQARNQRAWTYIVVNDLQPYDEMTAQMAGVVAQGAETTEQDVRRLLKIVDLYPDSEEAAAAALAAVFTSGTNQAQSELSEDVRSQFKSKLDDFTARYPQSEFLRAISAEHPEELLEMMGASSRARGESLEPLVARVRNGHLPYGVLQRATGSSYTQTLLTTVAGSMTSISVDDQQRSRERELAEAAIGGEIAVDTSAVTTGLLAQIDPRRISSVFSSILVGDELLADARAAVASTSRPVIGSATYDFVLGRASLSEVSEHQRLELFEKAELALDVLEGWQRVASGPLPKLELVPEIAQGPWEASVRVAKDKQCPLWCDDLGLRTLADESGVQSFSTWALYEVLRTKPEGMWLPEPLEMKMRLLRAGIADVPIALDELTQATTDPAEIGVRAFLSRPLAWLLEPQQGTLDWYVERVSDLALGTQRDQIPLLLHAAAYGLGSAAIPENRVSTIGALLAVTIRTVWDPEMVPALLEASRYAVHSLDPGGEPEPLPDAVLSLLRELEGIVGRTQAVQTVVTMFSKTNPPDRRLVTETIVLSHG